MVYGYEGVNGVFDKSGLLTLVCAVCTSCFYS